jgi:hypothetical protein
VVVDQHVVAVPGGMAAQIGHFLEAVPGDPQQPPVEHGDDQQ